MLREETVFRSASWFLIGNIINRLIVFFFLVLLAKSGAIHLGLFYLFIHIAQNISVLIDITTNTRFTYKIRKFAFEGKTEELKSTIAQSVSSSVILSSLGATVIIILFSALFYAIDKQYTVLMFLLLILTIPFQTLSHRISSILPIVNKFGSTIIIYNCVRPTLYFLSLLTFLVFLNKGVFGIILSHISTTVFIGILSLIVLFKTFPDISLTQGIDLKEIFPSKKIFILVSSMLGISLIDLLVVAAILGYDSLGRYVALMYLPYFVYSIPNSLFQLFYPVAAVARSKGQDIKKLTQKVMIQRLLIVVPSALFIIIFANEIVSLFFGKQYDQEKFILVFTISFILRGVSWVAERVLLAKRGIWQDITFNILFMVLFTLSALILIPLYGLLGAAYALLLTSALDTILRTILVRFETKIRLFSIYTLLT